ncbi:probable E3 ubiquitin-protein ligase MID2 [Mercenaria mercenaria]|uniref:probable E3 ubiquitin-protein ligase MID2 n=1 Tax=Mercenaria mercenaria TaxID=6596 RepID=UPI00234F2474|nr:probable E3 ubiquitin-protein ligase MID2 [Mercenaria mercenaria]
MADSVDGRSTSKEDGLPGKISNYQYECNACLQDGLTKQAEGFCLDCQHYLCDDCFKYHRLPRPVRHHRLLDKNEMPKRKISRALSENCLKHKGERINYYCKSHDAVGCNLCIFQEHRNCTDICTVVEKAEEFKDSDSSREMFIKLTDTGEKLDKQMKVTKLHMQTSEKSWKEAMSSINNFQKELNEKIDSLKNQMIKESEHWQNTTRTKVNQIEVDVNRAKGELDDLQQDLQIFEQAKLYNQLFIATNNVSRQQDELEEKMMQMERENEIRKYSFIPNEMLINLMQNVDALGEVFTQDIENPQESLKSFYNNYLEHGFRRWIPLSETSVIVLDHIRNCIHLIKGEKVSVKKLTSGPWDMTCTEENIFAVTLPSERKIQIMHISHNFLDENRIRGEQDIMVGSRCEGIVYAENDIFVTCSRPANVTRLEMNGNVKQVISSDEFGKALFEQPAYIAYHMETDTLYVSDRQTGSITAMSREGDVKKMYENVMKIPIAFVHDEEEEDVYVTGLKENGRNHNFCVLQICMSTGEIKSLSTLDYREFIQLSAMPILKK